MKKRLFLLLVCGLICLAGCNSSTTTTDTTTPKYNIPKKVVNYSGIYTSAGVGPDAAGDYSVEDDELELRGWSSDKVIHLRIPRDMYAKFFDSEIDYTPGNQIQLDGNFIEMTSKLRYRIFKAVDMKSMEIVSYPDVEDLKSIFDLYSSCSEDSDCDLIGGISPLECVMGINKDLKETGLKVLYGYQERLGDNVEEYEYKCPAPIGVACKYNTCMPLFGVEGEDYSQDSEGIALEYDELF